MVNHVAVKGQQAIMQQSALFDALPQEWDDLTANVAISFPILGIKGGKWHYRYRGEENILMDAQGRFPTPAIQVVILKAQKGLSRAFYPTGYVEGTKTPPACWSSDGVAPDISVEAPVNPVCATCPKDAWGSGATAAAPKAKACQQRRRTVVVPYSNDLTNEAGGGPILLSVPPGSLTNQSAYGDLLRDNRIHYAGIVTELSFTQDPNIAFPKIEFNYVKSLTDDEAREIIGMRDHAQVDHILQTKMSPTEMDSAAAVEVTPGVTPPPAAVQARPIQRTSVVQPPAPAPAPVIVQAAPPPPPPVAAPAARVGGFAMAPVTPAAPPAAGTIASAMHKAASPPPSQRPLVMAPPPAAEQAADPTGEAEEEATSGATPSAMNDLFKNLMGG